MNNTCPKCRENEYPTISKEDADSYVDKYSADPQHIDKEKVYYYMKRGVCVECLHLFHKGSIFMYKKSRELTSYAYRKELLPNIAKSSIIDQTPTAEDHRAPEQWAQLRRGELPCNLWLSGSSGAGKSFLAYCAANLALSKCLSAAEFSYRRIRNVSAEWGWESELSPFIKADCLILDDIDKVTWTARLIEVLFTLVDEREKSANKRGFVIVTSNMDVKALSVAMNRAKDCNPSMVNAILERMKTGMTKVEMKGKSLR